MNTIDKSSLLDQSKSHIQQVTQNILTHKRYTETSIQDLRDTLRKGGLEDPEVLISTLIYRLEAKQQLEYSFKTPYFVRCDVQFEDENEIRTLYFGRFPFTQDSIYSWVAPAAVIRFESPGNFSYTLPSGKQKTGKLYRKDQFMIVDQKILFMSTEGMDNPRDLVYQEYFSEQRTGFVLPEIVEQMEQAQDKIIRSYPYGSFLVSGAAGSGKTTLALHRAAYLLQSPETQNIFQPNEIIVFVQDASTKRYFSGLLPQLGINSVKIKTFDEWAMSILGIKDMEFIKRYGKSEEEKDDYEYSKKVSLMKIKLSHEKDISAILKKTYKEFFTNDQMRILEKQLKEKLLDRFDLTVLMQYELQKNNKFVEKVEKYIQQKSTRRYVKKQILQEVQYSLIIIDEAENYLSQQLQIIKSCISPKTNAIIYVGDLVQQTLPWTIKDWTDVNETFASERQVILQKVYRNTRQILEYIKKVGYTTTIPANIKQGKKVEERVIKNKKEEIEYVKKILLQNKNNTIGVLAKSEEYLIDYKKELPINERHLIMSINEAQGVEFDIVILVGVNKELYINNNKNTEIVLERKKVDKDLLYVALTRGISSLYICGNTKLVSLLTA